jgi:uncharacterized protein (TIGR01244 family)
MRTSLLALLAVTAVGLPSCQSDLPPGGIAEPVPELAKLFSTVTRDGDVYFAGKPTQLGLETAVGDGVKTVISLMPVEEARQSVAFDEEATVEGSGARFVRIPVTIESFSVADVDAFADAWSATDGKILMYCSSSNRVGGMWAAYLIRYRAISQDEALGAGLNAGLKTDAMIEAVRRVASTP